MMPSDLTSLTIAPAVELMKKGELSASDLTQACLQRIQALNPVLNIFITVATDEARQAAAAADQILAGGGDVGLLHGIPVALKDSFDVKGYPTTAGSAVLRDNIASDDSEVAKRLREAGAVILGKLNMHEWAMGATTRNDYYGWCRNPWDPKRIPGGSSGGSGAALAAGMCLGTIGGDTGGSVRFPAALNGVVGIRPSFGRISLRGNVPIAWSYDTAGPLARTAYDVALMTQVLAGYDPGDPVSVNVPVDDYLSHINGGVAGMTLGVPKEYFFDVDNSDIADATYEAIRVFESLGARAKEIKIPGPKEAYDYCTVLIWSEAANYHRERMEKQPEAYSPENLEFIKAGSKFSGMDYANARHGARTWHRMLMRLMDDEGIDVIVTPMTSIIAPLIEESNAVETSFKLVQQAYPFSLIRIPAMSVPCGFVDNMPVGMQLLARDFEEAQLYRVSHAYQQVTDWHTRRPNPDNLIIN